MSAPRELPAGKREPQVSRDGRAEPPAGSALGDRLPEGLGNRALLSLHRAGRLQRKAREGGGQAAVEARSSATAAEVAVAAPAAALGGELTGGHPLDRATRKAMEAQFGARFDAVRIHTDPRAGEAATALGARAFTVGEDIAFADGEYAPETSSGRRLLGHELAHVVQQRAAPGPIAGEHEAERDADAAAVAVGSGRAIDVKARAGAGTVQRAPGRLDPPTLKIEEIGAGVTAVLVDGASVVEIMSPPGAGGVSASGTWVEANQSYRLVVTAPENSEWEFLSAEASLRPKIQWFLVTVNSTRRYTEKAEPVSRSSGYRPAPSPPKPQPKSAPPPRPKPAPGPAPAPQVEPDELLAPEPTPLLREPSPRTSSAIVSELADRDPPAAIAAAERMSVLELAELQPEARLALLQVLAGHGKLRDAELLLRSLATTPREDAGGMLDALKADPKLMLRLRELAGGGHELQLELALMDLSARSHGNPSLPPEELSPQLAKPFDLADALKGPARDPREVVWAGDPELRPSWTHGLKLWRDPNGSTHLWTPEMGVTTWDPDGKRTHLPTPGLDEMSRALRDTTELTRTGGRRYVPGKGWLDEAAWQQYAQADAGKVHTENASKMENLASGATAWKETQHGWATVPSVLSHLLGGRSRDDADKIVAGARQDEAIGVHTMEKAVTPWDLAAARRYALHVPERGEHDLFLYRENVEAGGQRLIIGIKIGAVVATAYVSAPVLFTYGGGVGMGKLMLGGAVAGGGLSAARQGVQLWEGSRRDFSMGEVGQGVLMGGALPLVPELAPIMAGVGVANAAEELSQGHYATGLFDLATVELPFAIKGAPAFGKWARPRVAGFMMHVGTGFIEVPGIGGRSYTPNLPGIAMMAEAPGASVRPLVAPRSPIAAPRSTMAAPEIAPASPLVAPVGPQGVPSPGGWLTVPSFGAPLWGSPAVAAAPSAAAAAPRSASQPPSDPYDVAAWRAYYAQNPHVGRSVGAASIHDPSVAPAPFVAGALSQMSGIYAGRPVAIHDPGGPAASRAAVLDPREALVRLHVEQLAARFASDPSGNQSLAEHITTLPKDQQAKINALFASQPEIEAIAEIAWRAVRDHRVLAEIVVDAMTAGPTLPRPGFRGPREIDGRPRFDYFDERLRTLAGEEGVGEVGDLRGSYKNNVDFVGRAVSRGPFFDWPLMNDRHGEFVHLLQLIAVQRRLNAVRPDAKVTAFLKWLSSGEALARKEGREILWREIFDIDPGTSEQVPSDWTNNPESLSTEIRRLADLLYNKR